MAPQAPPGKPRFTQETVGGEREVIALYYYEHSRDQLTTYRVSWAFLPVTSALAVALPKPAWPSPCLGF